MNTTDLATGFGAALPFLLLVAWVNGSAVSPDQKYVRSGVILLVLIGAICIRLCSSARRPHAVSCERSDPKSASEKVVDSRTPRLVIALILLHSVLVGWCACRNSFSWTETGLLPTGVIDWRYSSFDVFRVNPPLVRMWATLPVLAFDPEIPFRGVSSDPTRRAEWDVARAMIETNGEVTWTWLTVARLWCLPFLWAGMWTAWRWSSQLFGRHAGIGCLLIWTFSPLMIGYGCLIAGDAQAACMGLVTLYAFRQWLRNVQLETSYILGLVAGLTVLTKTSWMALFGLLPLLWLLIRSIEWVACPRQPDQPSPGWKAAPRETGLAIGSMVICLLVINLAYGLDGSFKRLDSFDFISKALTHDENWRSHDYHGNRFIDSWAAALPVPLPEDMVVGMDLQKWDFDRVRSSYFRGEWRNYGWWYYYLYALAIKVPLALWLLLLLATAGAVRWPTWRADWRDNLILLLPVALVLGAASAETGLNRHVRYVMPIIPLLFVSISRVFIVFGGRVGWMRRVVVACLSWMMVSILWIYPHSHSYFNEIIGGPLNGFRHLNASNLDWGQDLKFLKRWCEAHPDQRPIFTKAYLHLIDHQKMGIVSAGSVPSTLTHYPEGRNVSKGRFPRGWYIVDHETMLRETGDYRYLLDRLDTARTEHIGYGFVVFQVDEELSTELQYLQTTQRN